MLSFTDHGDFLTMSGTHGRPLRFRPGITHFWVGHGEATYEMSRGRFKFTENAGGKTRLNLTVYRLTETGAELEFCSHDGLTAYTVVLTAAGERLDVHFEPLRGAEGINRLYMHVPASRGEHIYGCGEVFTHLDLRGQKVRVWVAEHINISSILSKLVRERVRGKDPEHRDAFDEYETYYSQPTFISSRRFYMHADTTGYCMFNFTHERVHELEFREIADLHFGFAADFPALMENLSELLGRQPELPDWVYDGAILGIQGGTKTLTDKLTTADAFGTKVAGVWCQDWEGRRVTAFGKQLMWNWVWDSELYPGLPEKLKELHEKGVRFLGYVNPFLAIEKELYAYAAERGYCVKDREGNDYLVKITTFPAAMVDLTNPEAYDWLKGVIKENMIAFGLDGWMADFGEYLPTDAVLFSGEDPELVHCTWPALWAKLNREAIEESGKLGEVFFFTRAGHTGSVKYSTMMWNGDQHVDWSRDYGLGSVITGTLALAASGFGLCHSDIGGYTTFPPLMRSEELFIRWAEMCAFSPLMRGHEGNRPDDNAQFDASAATLIYHAKMSRAHAMLKPYLKAMARLNSEKGLAVMRPLFFSYDEPRAYTEDTEYLLGGDLLVAPVLREGMDRRRVWLPQDNWVHLWTGIEYKGGSRLVSAPFGCPPVFYRRDSEYRELFEKIREAEK